LSLLRAEKGYILIGVDTDGTTLPADLGMAGSAAAKTVDFVGKRSLLTPDALREDRRQLVGLRTIDPQLVLPVGAHAFVREDQGSRSIGWVTTSAFSPWLGHSIALAMIERGRDRVAAGAEVDLFSEGKTFRATVTAPCFYDPQGGRLRG
jgi:sarcosine oxidase subunit alpha